MAKNAKGNKTAHVLNLLTAPGSKEAAPADEPSTEGGVPETPAAEGAVSEAPAAVSSRPLLPPILEVAQANDDNLARQIQQALEDEYQADAPRSGGEALRASRRRFRTRRRQDEPGGY